MSGIVQDPSPQAIALAMEANWCAYRRALGGAPGVHVRDDAEFFSFTTPAPAGWFNAILRATLAPETVEDAISATEDHFRAHGTPWIWIIGPGSAPEDLADRLTRRGFTTNGSVRGMAWRMPDAPLDMPVMDGAEILAVRDEATFALWESVVLQDDAGNDHAVASLVQQLVVHSAMARDRTHFVALLKGEPVGTATVALAAGVAGLYGVRTLPHARKRGIGNALTLASLRYAQEQGYTVTTLQASSMGYPLYYRLGFRVAQRFPVFTPPAMPE
jgi:GNAT superfamily N-acetyltransferase